VIELLLKVWTGMLGEQILELVNRKKTHPEEPIWGEIFYLLYKAKRDAEKKKKQVVIYQIEDMELLYLPEKKRFYLEAEGITFYLTIEELATALFERRFLPVMKLG
jgi:hypothetical protein